MRCRHCGTPLRHTFVDLGMSPLCRELPHQDRSRRARELLSAPRPSVPLVLASATSGVGRFPAHIFTEYAYFSSYSTTWLAHADRYCETIKGRLGLRPKSFVVELGSNDGYLLQHFLRLECQCLGSNPLPMWRRSGAKGRHSHVVLFFSSESSRTDGGRTRARRFDCRPTMCSPRYRNSMISLSA